MIGEAMPSITDRTDIQIRAKRFFTIETIPATIPIKAPAGPIMQPNPPHTITPKTESITSIVRYSFAVGPANNRVPVSAEHINPNPDNASAMIDSTNGASGFFTGREPGMFVCWIDILLSPPFSLSLIELYNTRADIKTSNTPVTSATERTYLHKVHRTHARFITHRTSLIVECSYQPQGGLNYGRR